MYFFAVYFENIYVLFLRSIYVILCSTLIVLLVPFLSSNPEFHIHHTLLLDRILC